MPALDFSSKATPVKLPDFSAQATPVAAPDFSAAAAPAAAESQTFVPFPAQPSPLDSIVNGAENFGAALGDTGLQAGSEAAGALDLAGHTALYPFLSDQQRNAALSAAQTEFQQAQDYGQAAASHTGITGGAGRLVGGLGTFLAGAAGSPAYSGASTLQHGGSVGQAEANLGTDAAAQELFMALGGGKPGANGVKNRLLNLLLGGAEKTRLGAGVGAAARTVGVSAAQQATQHAIDPNTTPAVNLGDVVTNPAPYVVAALSALGHGAGGAEAAKPATKPAADTTTIEAALREAGFSPEQIDALKQDGSLADIAAAATPAPRPALQGPPPESPLPVAATRALPAPEPEAPALPALPPPPRRLAPPTVAVDSEGNAITTAQAMEQARAADAAAQERQNLGLTPAVERAQQVRQAGVQATEAETLAHGAPGESPIPEVPEKPISPVDPAVAQHYFDDIGNEIGWDQVGGRMLRASDGTETTAADPLGIGPEPGRPAGDVTGRTTWIGMPRVDGEGESNFWRNRPPNARLTPDAARAALTKYRAGEPLKPVEQRFVDYARQQAHEYAQEHADETARQAMLQRDMDQEALTEQHRALNEDAKVRPQDFGEALTLQQWVERAHNAGATREEVTGALEQSPNESAGAVRALARLVHEKEGGHAADTRATSGDREPGVRPGGTGRAVPDAEAGAGIEESQGPRGDLFGAPTSAERIRGAREAKDAERNGLNREGRKDIHAGGGTLFEGRAPEQVDIPENAAQDTSYGNTVAIPSGAKRNGNTVAEPGIASRGRPGPEIQGQLDFFAAKDAPQAVRRSARNFAQHAKNVQIGTFKTGVTRVLSAEQAAHVIAPIRKNAYEHMVALVLDADAHPLAVIQHATGTIDGAGVYPGDLFGEIASVPGARSVWLAHNHPSGVIEQSGADRNMTTRIADLLRGSGIEVHGMLVVGPGNKRASLFHPEYSNVGERGRYFNGTYQSARDIASAPRQEDVPVMGRKLSHIPSQQERVTLTSPRDVVAWADEHVDGPGIILLDNRHRALGFAPLDEQEMALLRTGDASRGSAEVARQVKGANAAAAIVVSNNLTDAQNVGALLRDLSVRPLDILEGKQGKYESAASRGLSLASPDFHSEEPGPEVSESSLSHEDQQLVQQTRERAARQQDNRSLEDVESDESRQRGEQEAGDLGLRGAVVDALGELAGRVHFVHDALGLPKDVRQRMAYTAPIKRGNVRYGLMTADGEAYIFTEHANTPERAVWTAIHEVGGHAGVRELVNAHPDVKVGKRTVKDAYAAARNLFLQNPTVRALAEVIAKQRGSKDLPRMAEEAMAELQAATRTGRWDEITRKYGVDVPKGVREGVQGAIANFVRRLKAILNAIHAKVTGKSDAFTDADVHDMLGRMFEAAKGERGGEDLASEERADQTETPAFKRWFGNSKVVDSHGKPLEVYHETSKQAEAKIMAGGFSTAEEFARARLSDEQVPNGIFFKPQRGRIGLGAVDDADTAQIPVHLSIQNPLYVPDRDTLAWHIRTLDPEYADGERTQKEIDKRFQPEFDRLFGRDEPGDDARIDNLLNEWKDAGQQNATKMRSIIDRVLEREGYDGVIIRNDAGSMGRRTTTYIALKPTQVKSSVANRGTFDPEDANILHSEEPRDRAGGMGHGASGPAPEGETTGIKNAQTKAERIARGLDELDAEGKRSFGTVWETAAGKLHDEPMAGQLLADEIARNPRPLKPEETALLAQDRARILVQRRKAAQESIDAAGDETAQAIAQAKLDLANQQLEVNDKAARQSGYEQGLGLAMRKAMAALDYSLDAMEQRMEAAKGRPLTPEEHKTLADLDAKLRAADEQVQAAKGTARMAGRATKGDLQAQLRLFADELHEAVSKRDRIRQNQLRKQIRETAERIAKGDFAEKPKRQPFAYNEETRRLEAERNKLRRKFDRMAERARMQQWSRPRRAFEFLYELRRAIILSGLHTLGKLTTAALYRVGLSPLEHLVQSGLGAIPGIHKIAARAPLEGGFSPGAELAGMKALFSKETLAEMGRKFGDRGIYDLMYGKNHASLYPWLDLVGQVHGALKVPEERTAFAVALTKFIKFERKQAKAQGLSEPAILDHLSRPDVQARLEAAAYAESKRSIFMQDNAVVSGMRGLESMLRNAGKNKAGGKLLAPLADVMHWMFPIVRVPSNYIGEAFSYLGGGAKAAAELAASGALKKGVDALTPEQADYIMRNLGKQTVGAALLALGYFGYQAFPGKIGTWYQQGDNKRRGVPKEGSIFGVPQYLAEHPAFFMVTIGANFRRVVEGMRTKTGKTMVGTGTVSDAALNSMIGLLRQTPFMYPFENLQDKTRNAGAFGKFVSDETVGSYVPPDLRRFASAHDTDSAGKPIKRYPHGFVDALKMNVPGLREQVPTKRNPNR